MVALAEMRTSIERMGLYEEVLNNLVDYALKRYEAKKSIVSYALWNAMKDVYTFFDDNQGVELHYALKIDNARKQPISDLISLDVMSCRDEDLVPHLLHILEQVENLRKSF